MVEGIELKRLELIEYILQEFNLGQNINSLSLLGEQLKSKYSKKSILIVKGLLNSLKLNSYDEYNHLITRTLSLPDDLFYEITKNF